MFLAQRPLSSQYQKQCRYQIGTLTDEDERLYFKRVTLDINKNDESFQAVLIPVSVRNPIEQ